VQFWAALHQTQERKLASDLTVAFREAGRQVISKVISHLKDGAKPAAAVRSAVAATNLRNLIKDLAEPHLDRMITLGATSELKMYLPKKQAAMIVTKRGGGRISPEQIRLPKKVRAAMDVQKAIILKQPYWRDIADTYRDQIANKVQKGIEDGKSTDEIADELKESLGEDGSKARAENIARTETTGFLQAGQQAAREELADAGVIKGKTWLSIIDDDTREDHVEANGQTVAFDEPFVVGGEECDYPGDVSLSPEQRCRCRCCSTSVLDSDEGKSAFRFTIWESGFEGRLVKCGGPGSGVPGPCAGEQSGGGSSSSGGIDASKVPATESGLHEAASKAVSSWVGMAKNMPSRMLAVAGAKIKSSYAKLESEHGKKMAIAIIASGIVGTALPVPGTSLALPALLIGASRLYRKYAGKKEAEKELDMESVKTLAERFWKKAKADWQVAASKIEDEKRAAWFVAK